MRVSREISLGSSLHRASTDALIPKDAGPTTGLGKRKTPLTLVTSTTIKTFVMTSRGRSITRYDL